MEEKLSVKRYKMNTVGQNGITITVAIPPEVIDQAAENAGLSPEDFIKQYQAIAHYGRDGKTVQYTFAPILPNKG